MKKQLLMKENKNKLEIMQLEYEERKKREDETGLDWLTEECNYYYRLSCLNAAARRLETDNCCTSSKNGAVDIVICSMEIEFRFLLHGRGNTVPAHKIDDDVIDSMAKAVGASSSTKWWPL
ncbi:unnamed protein product [Acanthoscelides obtectus]|uniref:Uncharacterized protein n=1 Tax=Acanthoscelides obtectus TaxID=200917 RepID=A0A9P0JQ91_ACAOB|nr:unnamed protein product [Acanthoscelides obtectus]CAK1672355.1 hypothetical protein AOBTE_LOCUS28815 [Acanthoscelides obtectus]